MLSKAARGATAIALCAGLAGCVTAQPTTPADLAVLRLALLQPISTLRDRAESGEARAQYALALAHAYGLQGADPDPALATRWRQRALAARGYTPITTYIAGLRGKPGRVSIINTPRYDLNAAEAMRNDQCGAVLARGEPGSAESDICAGPQELARLKLLWALAIARP